MLRSVKFLVLSMLMPLSVVAVDEVNEGSFSQTRMMEKAKASRLDAPTATLEVGEGVLKQDLNISISSIREANLPKLDKGMTNVTDSFSGYRFLPHGEHFAGKGAKVVLGYDRTKIPSGYTEDDIRTYYYDETEKRWIPLQRDSIDRKNRQIISRTTHFTDMINGVIQAPESPETQGFAPTMMSDLQAADPTSKVQLIEAPQANQTGSASLSYSLEMPPARNGMSPNLSIQYSSDAASGWLGEGWNLTTSSIAVDTRWGVPRYNPGIETETYLLDGQMLLEDGVGLAHRNPGQNRPAPKDKRVVFHPRKESAFSEIVRIGDDPSRYIWEVTDRRGTKYTYGAYQIGKVTENGKPVYDDYGKQKQDTTYIGVLKGNWQNSGREVISEWRLTRIEEVHGDYVEYVYRQESELVTGSLYATALYLDSVKAGNAGENPHTIVVLHNKKEAKNIKRSDARYGYLTSSNQLLENVEVFFEGEYLRGYKFGYTQGAFGVDLLESIAHVVKEGETGKEKIFASHVLTYKDDVSSDDSNTYNPFQLKTSSMSSETGDIDNFFDKYLSFTGKNLTTLGGNKSLSSSFNTYVGGGLGDYSPTKSMTAGMSYTHGKTETDGVSAFIDLNGDGLPDKVYLKGDEVHYRPQTSDGRFGKDETIQGISAISHSVNKSNAFGGKVHLGWGPALFVGGGDYNASDSETDIYFSDVNSDGLVDLVNNGIVYFNRLENGVPKFEPTSSGTPNPINARGEIELSFDSQDPEEQEKLKEMLQKKQDEKADNSPLQDIVRVWCAPFSGTVDVSGDVQFITPEGNTLSNDCDGVFVSIQCDDVVIMDPYELKAGDEAKPVDIKSIKVAKGQKLYFRVQSGRQKYANGENDIVSWNPIIRYQGESNLDADGKEIGLFALENGMLFTASSVAAIDSSTQKVDMSSNERRVVYSSAKLNGRFSKPITSDDVKIRVIAFSDSLLSVKTESIGDDGKPVITYNSINNPNYIREILYEETFAWDKKVDQLIDLDGLDLLAYRKYNEATGEEVFLSNIKFEIYSNSNVAFDEISWNPSVFYTPSDSENDAKDDKMIVDYVYYSNYVNHVSKAYFLPEVDESIIEDLRISPVLKRILADEEEDKDYKVRLSVKGTMEKLAAYEFKYNHNTQQFEPAFVNPFQDIKYEKGKEIWFELYYDNDDFSDYDSELRLYAEKTILTKDADGNDVETIETIFEDQFSVNMYSKISDNGFGPMYKGWGMFSYSATVDRFEKPIDTSELGLTSVTSKFQDDGNGNLKKKEDGSDYGLDDMTFVTLRPDAKTRKWIGQDPSCYIDGALMSSSRLGDQHVIVEDPLKKMMDNLSKIEDKLGSGACAISILSESSSDAEMLGGGAFGVNLTGSLSHGKGGATQLFTDMNGDGYPDVVTEKKVQYTNTLGGFSGEKYYGNCTDNSKSESLSFGIGGAPQHYEPNGGKPAGGSAEKNGQKVQLNAISFNKATASASASINAYAFDETKSTMVDMNGDGLPDKVMVDDEGNLYVSYNTGYSFSGVVSLGQGKIKRSSSSDAGLGVCVDIGASSFSAGASVNATTSQTEIDLRDVNGDGLPDIVKIEGSDSKVKFNTGTGFSKEYTWKGLSMLSQTKSTSASVNANATVSVTVQIVFVPVKFSGSGGGSVGFGLSGDLVSFQDVDGDGYADMVTAKDDESLIIRYSALGATNKLHTVTNPFGGTFSIDYAHTQPTTDHPGGKWAMSALTVNDGTGMNPEMKTTFSYEGGKHDRRERDFLGFGKVITTNMDGENKVRSEITQYDVDNYLSAGAPIHTEVVGYKNEEETQKYRENATNYVYFKAGKNGDLKEVDKVKGQFIEKTSDTEYVVLGDDASIFYAPKEKSTKAYEEDAELDLTKEMYTYSTSYGNLFTYQFTDLTNNVGYSDTITYSNPKLGLATDVKIYGSDGNLYRHVSASYKDKKTPYAMTQMVQYIDDEKKAVFNFEYDKTGNMIRKTFPNGDKSSKQDSMFFKYTYDRKYNMYPERVEDAFGYHSEMEDYDYRYGEPKTVRDMNGYTVLYEFDDLGRTAKIIAPKEQREGKGDGKEYTVSYEYNDKGDYKSRYAITNHYDPQHPENSIQTVTHVDGLGRPFQVKKDAEIEGVEKMIVSGRVEYDHLGRTIATYHPSTCDLTSKTGIVPFGDQLLNSSTYDAIDRPLSQTLPGDEAGETTDASVTKMSYAIVGNAQKTTTIDPREVEQYTYTNGAGQTIKTSRMLNSEEVSIDYKFDPIGQLLSVKDAGGNITAYTYDNAGRKLSVEHPSAGLTTFVYDVAGNMIERETPNLHEKKQSITYKYEKNRLMEVVYPEHEENNVKYTYGGVNAEHNRVGRVAMIEDGSGAQEFFYGSMGEVTKQRRTLVIPNQAVASYTTEWKYDSHNRLEEMTYPDGEVISYKYNLGGLLSSVVGKKEFQYTYVENIGYDEYEQRNYVEYGNGTKTSYEYSPIRRRLSNLRVISPAYNGENIMNNSYTYDAMDNITKLFNNVNAKGAKKEGKTLAGALLHRYTYDDWNRLIDAEGFYAEGGESIKNVENTSKAKYQLHMEYDKLYNVTSKTLDVEQTNMQFDGTLRAGHQLTYQYDENNPFKLLSVQASEYRVSDESADIEKAKVNTRADYAFDKNGNQISVGTGVESEDDQSLRKLLWDEDNRLLAVSDNGFVSNYFYDAGGERTVKVAASQEALFVNSVSVKDSTFSQRFVAYVSPYFVVKNGGEYTKHIYAGDQRIASKVGDFESFGADPRRVAMAGADVPNSKVSYADKYTALIERMSNDYDSLGVEYNIKDNNDFKNNESFCCDKTNSLGGYSSFEGTSAEEVSKEALVFFYHPDHLGSTGLVTDAEGVITQHVAYIPYGEVFVEERNGVWNTPYLFNAKELDEETGLYYYGARYLNPKDTRWLSVDPLFEKYVGMSPYQYCHNNPMNRIDVDGRFDTEDEATEFIWNNDMNGMIVQREEGGYSIIDQETGNEYYHDSNKELNVNLSSVEVVAQKPTPKPQEKSVWDNFCDGYVDFMTSADAWSDRVMFPIVAGASQLLPPIGLTNDVMTLRGQDMFGNKTSGTDKTLATADICTFGLSKIGPVLKIGKGIGVITISDKIFESTKLGKTSSAGNQATTYIGAWGTMVTNWNNTHQNDKK